MKITLYSYWRSSCSWRVRWALLHKGLPFDLIPVNLLKGEQRSEKFLHINPAGKLPMLKIDDDLFTGSVSIIEYLEELFPVNPLLPQNPRDRAIVRELAHTIAMDTQPLGNLSVIHRHSNDEMERKAWAAEFNRKGLSAFQALRERYGFKGHYSFRSQLTLADLCLIPQCYNASRFEVNLKDEYPELFQIYQHCLNLSNCIKSSPESQPDAVLPPK